MATSNIHIVYKLMNRLKYHAKNIVYPVNHRPNMKDKSALPYMEGGAKLGTWLPWLPEKSLRLPDDDMDFSLENHRDISERF